MLTAKYFQFYSLKFLLFFVYCRKLPSGCDEQRLKAFIPNVVSLIYLNATQKLTQEKSRLGDEALRIGVQQTLETLVLSGTNKGAFSIWGRKSQGHSDSIW